MGKTGAATGILFGLGLTLLSLQIVSSGPAVSSRSERSPGLSEDITSLKESILGGKCLTNDQCSAISYCDTDDLEFSCKLTWWFILACAAVALFLLSSIISCLCCPCCCLYNLGKSICDCLCCCCKPSRGRYSRP